MRRRAADAVAGWRGRLDILFNNAGISNVGVLHEIPEDEWDRVMAVNVRGVYLMAKYAVPHMIAQGGGCIINMSSGAALVGLERRAVYSATKGAVLALTRAMAVDYAEYHIRVNALCPGTVYTPFVERYLRTSYADPAAALEKIKQRQLTGTLGRPEEIAAAALYLASDAAFPARPPRMWRVPRLDAALREAAGCAAGRGRRRRHARRPGDRRAAVA